MALKKKVVQIDTNNAQKSIKSMRDELKELKDQLVNLDQGTLEYAETLQKAANISHELKDMNQELAASAMDFGQIIGNVTSTIGGAVSGFQALSASMSLLGIENEEALEQIKKLQALMALTQGIAGVENGIKSFKRLVLAITNSTAVTKLFNKATTETAATETAASATTKGLQGAMVGEAAATKTATVATHAFKKALISTGIGAIIVAVGVLIANLDKLAKFLGFGSDSAENQKKALAALEAQYKSIQGSFQATNAHLEQKIANYRDELKAMDDKIAKMKAEGASEAAITAQMEADMKRRKEINEEYVEGLNSSQKTMEKNYKDVMKSIVGNTYSFSLSMRSAYNELAEAEQALISTENRLAKLQANENSNKGDIRATERRLALDKQRVAILNGYIATQKKELDLIEDINDREKQIANERIERARKLRETLTKFDNQLLLDTLKNKDKELEQIKQSKDARIKELDDLKKEGALTKQQYKERLDTIKAYYDLLKDETEAKWAQKESKKREDLLKQQLTSEKNEMSRQRTELKMIYDAEHLDNLTALRNREISIIEYYNREKEIIARKSEEERLILETQYKKENQLIAEQINERYDLLAQEGLSDDDRAKIISEVADLTQQLYILETNHAAALAELAAETNSSIAELNQATIEQQMEALRILTENVVGAMDSITGIGEGLSSQWATAFDTMSNGLINLGQKIKEGGAQWQDYAQLAVAAFQAAGSVMNALADEQETNTKEGFEQQKKYQIAAVTMNMLGGVISAWTSALNPANAWMTIWGQIAMGAATTAMILATGIMQIQKIKQQQFEGSSGASAGASSGAMSNVVAPVQYTQDVQGAEIEGAIKDQRVYVTEGDITSTQNKVEVAQSENRY